MFVAGDLRLARVLFGMLLPLLEAGAEGFPVLVDQDQNGIGHLAGERLIAVKLLHPVEDLGVGEILALMNECLPHLVGGLVIQVLRGKRGSINGPGPYNGFAAPIRTGRCGDTPALFRRVLRAKIRRKLVRGGQ